MMEREIDEERRKAGGEELKTQEEQSKASSQLSSAADNHMEDEAFVAFKDVVDILELHGVDASRVSKQAILERASRMESKAPPISTSSKNEGISDIALRIKRKEELTAVWLTRRALESFDRLKDEENPEPNYLVLDIPSKQLQTPNIARLCPDINSISEGHYSRGLDLGSHLTNLVPVFQGLDSAVVDAPCPPKMISQMPDQNPPESSSCGINPASSDEDRKSGTIFRIPRPPRRRRRKSKAKEHDTPKGWSKRRLRKLKDFDGWGLDAHKTGNDNMNAPRNPVQVFAPCISLETSPPATRDSRPPYIRKFRFSLRSGIMRIEPCRPEDTEKSCQIMENRETSGQISSLQEPAENKVGEDQYEPAMEDRAIDDEGGGT